MPSVLAETAFTVAWPPFRKAATVAAYSDLPERYCISVLPVTTHRHLRSTIPARKYLLEQHMKTNRPLYADGDIQHTNRWSVEFVAQDGYILKQASHVTVVTGTGRDRSKTEKFRHAMALLKPLADKLSECGDSLFLHALGAGAPACSHFHKTIGYNNMCTMHQNFLWQFCYRLSTTAHHKL